MRNHCNTDTAIRRNGWRRCRDGSRQATKAKPATKEKWTDRNTEMAMSPWLQEVVADWGRTGIRNRKRRSERRQKNEESKVLRMLGTTKVSYTTN